MKGVYSDEDIARVVELAKKARKTWKVPHLGCAGEEGRRAPRKKRRQEGRRRAANNSPGQEGRSLLVKATPARKATRQESHRPGEEGCRNAAA